ASTSRSWSTACSTARGSSTCCAGPSATERGRRGRSAAAVPALAVARLPAAHALGPEQHFGHRVEELAADVIVELDLLVEPARQRHVLQDGHASLLRRLPDPRGHGG